MDLTERALDVRHLEQVMGPQPSRNARVQIRDAPGRAEHERSW